MGDSYLYQIPKYTLQYNVLEMIPHPDFNFETLNNDLGLFFIDGYIALSYPTVAVIPLNNSPVPYGTICFVTGWGLTSNDNVRLFKIFYIY